MVHQHMFFVHIVYVWEVFRWLSVAVPVVGLKREEVEKATERTFSE